MIYVIVNIEVKIKDKNFILLSINFIPILLMLATSALTGAVIRTMWMTPFIYFWNFIFFNFKKVLT